MNHEWEYYALCMELVWVLCDGGWRGCILVSETCQARKRLCALSDGMAMSWTVRNESSED